MHDKSSICHINIIFMVAGIFLNSVVIINSCIVLFWSCCSHHHSSVLDRISIQFLFLLEKLMKNLKGEFIQRYWYILLYIWLLDVCAFYADCWTIPSPNVSNFPSSISHKNKASSFSCIFDGYIIGGLCMSYIGIF
jgi:hypothetical protein